MLYGLAVLGVCAAVYALGIFVFSWLAVDARGAAVLTGRYDDLGPLGFGYWNPGVFVTSVGGTLLLIGLGALYKMAQLSDGGSAVAEQLGGRRVDPDTTRLEERRLLNVVEEMAIASGIPVPDVFVLDHEAGINAFAAGHTSSDAVVGVTQGTLQLLKRDELQGVIAHEFSHILNGDSRLNLRAIGLLHGLFLVALIGRLVLYGARGGRRDGASAVLIGLALLVIGSIGVFFGRLVQSAISRQREFLADASAVQFTRDKDGLASALKKIGGASTHSFVKAPQADEASHMFFSEAVNRLALFRGLFRTHPPLPDRILKLQPQWDGDYPSVLLPDISDGMSSPPDAPRSYFDAFAGAITPDSVREGLEHVGAPTPVEIDYAHALHSSLPDSWIHAVHQAPMAQVVVFGLLLSRNEASRGTELLTIAELTDPQTADQALRYHAEAGDRSSAEKIALIDMAMPALRNLTLEEYRRFHRVVESLIDSDRRVDLFEYTLSRMIRRHLTRHFERLGPTPVRFRSLKRLLPDVQTLLSALAHVGSRTEAQATAAFAEGAQVLRLGAAQVGLLPPSESTLRAVDEALDRFDAATPALKKSLMTACAATVMADDRVTDREVELIRAVGDSIDCPVPPFVAFGHHHGNPERLRDR